MHKGRPFGQYVEMTSVSTGDSNNEIALFGIQPKEAVAAAGKRINPETDHVPSHHHHHHPQTQPG